MQRINTAGTAADLFGPGKHGFRDGDPVGGIVATRLAAAWFNAVQEEIARVIEAAGIALNPNAYNQLLTAIQALVPGFVPAATTAEAGKVELATIAETQAGTDAQRAVTPSGLANLTASDGRRGLVELATAAEAETGTDTQRAVTPAGVKAAYAQFGLGGSVTFGGDLNTLTASGFYYASSEATNKPAGTNGHVIVSRIGQDANYVVQHCILGGTTEPREFVRVRVAGAWGAWREIWVGDIAQLLSANGYQRLPSGFIIQWGTATVPFSTSWAGQAIIYPIAFPAAALSVTAAPVNGTDVDVAIMVSATPSTTGATIRYKTDITGSSFTLRWLAIGY